jgi:hypothetical protein
VARKVSRKGNTQPPCKRVQALQHKKKEDLRMGLCDVAVQYYVLI